MGSYRAGRRRVVSWPVCTATVDTVPFGIVECHRRDPGDGGRDHGGPHYHDNIEDGRVTARVEWWDHVAGYGVTPAARLAPGPWDRMFTRRG